MDLGPHSFLCTGKINVTFNDHDKVRKEDRKIKQTCNRNLQKLMLHNLDLADMFYLCYLYSFRCVLFVLPL